MKNDQIIFDLIIKEDKRQRSGIELIASENFVSDEVMQAMGSCLTNKYAEGYPGKRYYGGCEVVDKVEQLAIDRAKELFGVEYVNVQPHSGSQANAAVLLACLNAGDKILPEHNTVGLHKIVPENWTTGSENHLVFEDMSSLGATGHFHPPLDEPHRSDDGHGATNHRENDLWKYRLGLLMAQENTNNA